MAASKTPAKFIALAVVLAAAAVLALCVGAAPLPISELIQGFADGSSVGGRILHAVRLPRLLAAMLAGAGFSASGALIQTVLANPLASPGVLGVNAGAGLAAAAVMAALPGAMFILPGAAFLGAVATMTAVFGIARRTGASKLTLALSGIAMGSLMTAGISALTTLFPGIVLGMRDFQIGGFAGVTLKALVLAGAMILAGALLALLFAGELEILGLGEETARSLGLRVGFWRFFFLTLASALCGAAVSFSGLIGFVGLIVPHCARLLFPGAGKRTLIAACLLMGAAFLTLCDTAARALFAPFELPVGILVAFLGAPFFLWLILRERRARHA